MAFVVHVRSSHFFSPKQKRAKGRLAQTLSILFFVRSGISTIYNARSAHWSKGSLQSGRLGIAATLYTGELNCTSGSASVSNNNLQGCGEHWRFLSTAGVYASHFTRQRQDETYKRWTGFALEWQAQSSIARPYPTCAEHMNQPQRPGWRYIGPVPGRHPRPRPRPPIEFLQLPVRALNRIYANLASRDSLALSATCRFLYGRTPLAYRTLIFTHKDAHENTLNRALDNLTKLCTLLHHDPNYRASVEAIAIVDAIPLPEWFIVGVDGLIARILSITHNLQVFQWCGDAHVRIHCPQTTIKRLRQMPSLRDLRIEGFDTPTDTDLAIQELRDTQPHLPSLERVVIRCSGLPTYWMDAFLAYSYGLKELDFMDKQHEQYDLRHYARSWPSLTSLVVSCPPMALESYTRLMREGLPATGNPIWPNLTSFSLDCQIDDVKLYEIVRILSKCELRRLRLVINAYGEYMRRFGPDMVHDILRRLRYLEELIFDQYNTSVHAPLPGSWANWGTFLRTAPNLRILTLPILFVLNEAQFSYPHLHSSLATFAEDFIDRHLRKPDFQEVRILNTVNPNADSDDEVNGIGAGYGGHNQEGGRGRTDGHRGRGYRVLRFLQNVDRKAELRGERGSYFVKYLGRQNELDEADMMFWMPRSLGE